MKVAIEYADEGDLDSLREHHYRVSAEVLKKKILAEEVLVAGLGRQRSNIPRRRR